MTDDKAHALLNAIDKRTFEGAIAWTESSTEGSFLVSFPTYSVIVRHVEWIDDRDNERSVAEFDIIDKNGRVIDTVLPQRLQFYGGIDPEAISLRIYFRAKDAALGVEQAVDELLRELGAKPPAGPDEEEIPF